MIKTVFKYFLQGLLYTAPVAITFYFFYEVFYYIDHLIPTEEIDAEDSVFEPISDFLKAIKGIPGIGVLIIFFGITLAGLLGNYLLRFPIFNWFENRFERVPLFNLVYSSIKDVVKSLTGQKQGFKKPVLVKLYENSEIRRLGFVTDEALGLLMDDEYQLVTVYVPHSFAISGQLFLVPPKYITPVNESSSEVMKYIIAGGITEVGGDKEDEG